MKKRLLVCLAISSSLALSPSAEAAETAGASAGADKAHSLYDSGHFAQAEQTYQSAITTAMKPAMPYLQQLSRTYLGLARTQAAQGKWQEAAHSFNYSLNLAESADMPRSFLDEARAGLSEANTHLGIANDQTTAPLPANHPATVLPLPVPRAAGSMMQTPGIWHSHVPTIRGNRGSYPVNAHDQAEQEYLARCAVNYAEQTAGANSNQTATAYLDLATVLTSSNQSDKATEPLKKAVSILPKLPANEQHDVALAMLDLAPRLVDADQPGFASLISEAVLKAAAPDSASASELAARFNRLADTLSRRKYYDKAEVYQKYAVTILEHASPKDDDALAKERLKLAALYSQENKIPTAIELYELALPGLEARPESQTLISTYTALATLYVDTGEKSKLKGLVDKLTHAIADMRSDNNYYWCKSVLDLAIEVAKQGDLNLSRQLYTQTLMHVNPLAQNVGSDWQVSQDIKTLTEQFEETGHLAEAENVYSVLINSRTTPEGETENIIPAYADEARFFLKHDLPDKAKAAADRMLVAMRKFGGGSRQYHNLPALATEFQLKQQDAEALALTQAAIDIGSKDPTRDLRDTISNYTRAATLLDKQGSNTQRDAVVQKAVTLVSGQLPGDLQALASPLNELISKQTADGHLANACQILTEISNNEAFSRNPGGISLLGQIPVRLAASFDGERMYDQAAVLWKQTLEQQTKKYGESSIAAAGTMQSYSNSLRESGKMKESLEMLEGAKAIQDAWMRQQRGEYGTYNPYAPLNETVRNYKLHDVHPDSST